MKHIFLLISILFSGTALAVNPVALWMPASLQQLMPQLTKAAEMAEAGGQMQQFREWSANPLFNAAMTFMEVFPVGLIVTLISAAILRRRGSEVVHEVPAEA